MSTANPLAIPAPEARPRRISRPVLVFLRNPTAMLGLLVLLTICLAALFAPVLYPRDPMAMVARPLLWPGQDAAYPLGTDSLGRDLAAGIVHGARISLLVGIASTGLGLLLGIVVGATAGYFGGRVDDLLVRVTEFFQTLPQFVLLVVLIAIAGPSVTSVSVAIGLLTWPTIARLVRAEYRSLREREFVMAARCLGYGHPRIMVLEILPNALPAVIVTASVMVATAILTESALAFMGLGDPNFVSWGSMIGEGRDFLRSAWYLATLPGLAIVFTVLAFNLIGDGLNDALNPRFSGEL